MANISLLPIEVLKYHVLIHLDNKDILSFVLTNKYYYRHYVKDIEKVPTIYERRKRIQRYENEKKIQKTLNIVLDRMYELKCDMYSAYHIVAKVYHKASQREIKNLMSVKVYYNTGHGIAESYLNFQKTISEKDNMCESIWGGFLNIYTHQCLNNFIGKPYSLYILVTDYRTKEFIWDNDNGKNYTVLNLPIYEPYDREFNQLILLYDWIDYKGQIQHFAPK